MGKIRVRAETGKLFFDFQYKSCRCREQTTLDDNSINRKRVKKILEQLEAEITLGTFEYAKYFPQSPMVRKFTSLLSSCLFSMVPKFADFADLWMLEMKIQWRKSHYDTNRGILDQYLIPAFGQKDMSQITKAEIIAFRAKLGGLKGRKNKPLSASRTNHVMNPLRMILNEAANRFNFSSPYSGVKSLKIPRSDVEPFSLEEVKLLIDTVREDFRSYFIVRFFTAMRSSEIDGLDWKFVDFERRQILVRQALVRGELIYTKNDGSYRTIEMSEPVFNALQLQFKATGGDDFVFCSRNGAPLRQENVTKRIWYPLLRHLGLRERRPYQTRHTAATLWLASGESPEWIATQMGHTTTTMLFRVYSRFVPNLTRRDGSAFERLLKQNFKPEEKGNG
ncbi:MAG: site-specific integrase [Desulfobulbaceae bacterium]|nr:site-specific integrase [Desulfobulbaceae bacterium]